MTKVPTQTTTEYTTVLYTNDDGWWTIQQITTTDIAKVRGNLAAEALIRRLRKSDGANS